MVKRIGGKLVQKISNCKLLGSGQFRESQELNFVNCFHKSSGSFHTSFSLRNSENICAAGMNSDSQLSDCTTSSKNYYVNSNINYFSDLNY